MGKYVYKPSNLFAGIMWRCHDSQETQDQQEPTISAPTPTSGDQCVSPSSSTNQLPFRDLAEANLDELRLSKCPTDGRLLGSRSPGAEPNLDELRLIKCPADGRSQSSRSPG
eukprot:gene10521-7489_t